VKPLLNCLYVTTEDAWLQKDGDDVVMNVDRTERARIPVHMLQSIVLLGRVNVSAPLLGFCAERGVTVSFLASSGRFLARVEGPVHGNVLLRRAQYRASDAEPSRSAVARHMVAAKIANQRTVLLRSLRDHGPKMRDPACVERTIERLRRILLRLRTVEGLDTIRGREGEAAQAYFEVFDELLVAGDGTPAFSGRNRRPPRDPVNAALSFVYTLLTHDLRSALESVGLDPAVGFLHRDRPGRASLSLDLAEELRPVIADRLVLSLFNRKQLTARSFRMEASGGVFLTDDARRTVLVAYQERKRDSIVHPFVDDAVQVGLIGFVQAQLLARHLRGDLDAYPPFFWK
jgi:CRISPR-associated protein Cas1